MRAEPESSSHQSLPNKWQWLGGTREAKEKKKKKKKKKEEKRKQFNSMPSIDH